MDELIEEFFDKEYEDTINENMFNFDYSLPEEELEQYVLSLMATPYSQFIDYVATRYCSKAIVPSEIPQISNYALSTIGVCNVLNDLNDPGLECTEIGKRLFTDGKERKDGAYFKFGENHVKGASFHGLTHCCGNKWFLTCLGRIYPQMDEEMRQYLSARTLLRNPFFHIVIAEARIHDVNIRSYMLGLSESTQIRRSSSCMHFLNVIINQCKIEGVNLHNISYTSVTAERKIWQIIDEPKKSAKYNSFIPVYSIRAACGAFNHDDSSEIEGWFNIEHFGIKAKQNYFIVHAEGSSMEPEIYDGDLCVFEYTNMVENGETMLVESNQIGCQHVIKVVQKHGDSITLHSLNPEYSDFALTEDDRPRITGRLISVLGQHQEQ